MRPFAVHQGSEKLPYRKGFQLTFNKYQRKVHTPLQCTEIIQIETSFFALEIILVDNFCSTQQDTSLCNVRSKYFTMSNKGRKQKAILLPVAKTMCLALARVRGLDRWFLLCMSLLESRSIYRQWGDLMSDLKILTFIKISCPLFLPSCIT